MYSIVKIRLSLTTNTDYCIHFNSYFACEDAEYSLLEVHDGIVLPFVAVDHPVVMETNNDVSAELGAFLQEGHMTNMEQIKSSCHIDYCVFRLCVCVCVCVCVSDNFNGEILILQTF